LRLLQRSNEVDDKIETGKVGCCCNVCLQSNVLHPSLWGVQQRYSIRLWPQPPFAFEIFFSFWWRAAV